MGDKKSWEKYVATGNKAASKIHKVMSEFKNKTLTIGKSKKKVKKRKQAIAIALSEARKSRR